MLQTVHVYNIKKFHTSNISSLFAQAFSMLNKTTTTENIIRYRSTPLHELANVAADYN